MENRRPTAGKAVAARGANRMRWLLLAAGVLVILLVLVSTARLFAPGNADPWRDRGAQTVGQSTPAVQAPVDEAEPPPQPALIIDAAAGSSPLEARSNPLALIQPAPGSTAEAPAAGSGTTRLQPGAAAGLAAGASPRRATAPPARAAQATASTAAIDTDSNLISTLLGLIRQDGGATAAPSAMDSLVAHILAENERTYTETNAALASLGQPQPAQADTAEPTRAQRELQACPAANTVQGINCRDRVCTRWAGRDPACPAL